MVVLGQGKLLANCRPGETRSVADRATVFGLLLQMVTGGEQKPADWRIPCATWPLIRVCRSARAFIPSFVRVIVVETCELLCLDLDAAEMVRGSLDADGAARLARTLKAFSDPTRLLIVQALAERELCGCDLGWVTGQSDKVVSHHLGRLRRDGLVTSRREGKVVFASLTERGRALLERGAAIAL